MTNKVPSLSLSHHYEHLDEFGVLPPVGNGSNALEGLIVISFLQKYLHGVFALELWLGDGFQSLLLHLSIDFFIGGGFHKY